MIGGEFIFGVVIIGWFFLLDVGLGSGFFGEWIMSVVVVS